MLRGLAHRHTEAVCPLPAPPLFFLLGEIAALQLSGPMPFQIEDRHLREFIPAFDAVERGKAVWMEPQRRLQLFEEQFDLPTQTLPFHNLLGRQTQVIGHQDLLHVDRLMVAWFCPCREDQLHLANRVYCLSPLVYVIRTRFPFRPQATGTDASLLDVGPLTRVKPDCYQLIGLQTVHQRFHLGTLPFGACHDAFRIQRYDPGVLRGILKCCG